MGLKDCKTMKPAPDKRSRGKPPAKMKQVTVNTVLLAQAMEIVDDLTLLKMRAKQLVDLLNQNTE